MLRGRLPPPASSPRKSFSEEKNPGTGEGRARSLCREGEGAEQSGGTSGLEDFLPRRAQPPPGSSQLRSLGWGERGEEEERKTPARSLRGGGEQSGWILKAALLKEDEKLLHRVYFLDLIAEQLSCCSALSL